MTNSNPHSLIPRAGGRARGAWHTLVSEAELESMDRQAGRDYIPMDVYIDTGTIDEHFHAASICDRWTAIHRLGP